MGPEAQGTVRLESQVSQALALKPLAVVAGVAAAVKPPVIAVVEVVAAAVVTVGLPLSLRKRCCRPAPSLLCLRLISKGLAPLR